VAVEVRWPSGQVDHYPGLAGDTAYALVEGTSEAKPLKAWPGAR
jgi:hypothetical protein